MESKAKSAQIVVIGAGFAGAATAWALSRRGVSEVLLVDKESTLGYHASGRNAAMCRQLVEHDEFCELSIAGARFLREPPVGFCGHPLVSDSGSLLLCESEAQLAELESRAVRHELRFERRNRSSLVRQFDFLSELACTGALFFPEDGVIDVHALLTSFVGGARRTGVRVELDCEVQGFRPVDGGVVVESSKGEILCRTVVDAAGAWAGTIGALAPASEAPAMQPMRRHLFISDATRAMGREDPFLWYLGDAEFYLRPEGQGLLLSACDETAMEPCDVRAAEEAPEILADRMAATTPALSDLRIANSWACLRTFTPNRLPHIGWDSACEWLFWVAGLGGHGATSAAAVGERAAEAILARSR